jgi:Ca2+-binding RTX toxin-like protein
VIRRRACTLAVVAVLSGWTVGTLVSSFVARATVCDVETWDGTSAADTRYDDTDGVDEDNVWNGHAGNDFLRALACSDGEVRGGADSDDLGGGSGADSLYGDDGADTLAGGTEGDSLSGGDGADALTDNQTGDADTASGGLGNDDPVDVADGDGNDTADGGSGTDHCLSDTGDSRVSCES